MKPNDFISVDAVCYENGKIYVDSQYLIKEKPLLIEADQFRKTIIRTPGDDTANAVGVCFMDKIIESPKEILSANFYSDDGLDKVVIELLHRTDKEKDEKFETFSPSADFKLAIDDAKKCVLTLRNSQPLHSKTGSAHASMLFDYHLNSLAFAEDVSRHNAFDKVIGRVFIDNNLSRVFVAAVSCRINYDMIKKVVRAEIPIIIGYGKPTAKAVDTALSYNITVAWMGSRDGFFIFTHKDRFIESK